MKFDPLVKSNKNELYLISNGSKISLEKINFVNADSSETLFEQKDDVVTAVLADWQAVEIQQGVYNEELLASLRESLKKLEENKKFAFIIPTSRKELADADLASDFIAAMVHLARRIKDCASVIGFAVPAQSIKKDSSIGFTENSWTQWFINEMSVKHSHYVYFAEKRTVKDANLCESCLKTGLVLY